MVFEQHAIPQDDEDSAPELHDLAIEQALLGIILRRNEAWQEVSDILAPEHFWEGLNGRLYEKTAQLIGEGRLVNVLTLRPYFDGDDTLKELGGMKYLAHIAAAGEWPVKSCREYARVLVELAERRRVLACLEDIRDMTANGHALPKGASIAAEAIERLQQKTGIERDRFQRHQYSLEEAIDIATTRTNDVLVNGRRKPDASWAGSTDLHKLLGGWRRKRFYVIAGRPGMGKSTVAISWLLRTAMKGHGVLIVSLEMSAIEVGERAAVDLAYRTGQPITYDAFSRDALTPDELARCLDAKYRIKGLPFVVEEKSNLSLGQIRATAQAVASRMASTGRRLEVVCIDHLGLVRASDRYAGHVKSRN
jgi:replicative DNA helicase